MPGPFPGMDPYLEHPGYWPGFHGRMIATAATILNAQLPPGFIADIGERLYLVQPARSIYPDVLVLGRPEPAGPPPSARTATATAADAPWRVAVSPDEIRESFVQVITTTEPERVVSVIEVLSPSNKSGTPGRELYRAKQRELFGANVSLLEIDLLRNGAHTVLAPYEDLEKRGRWDYLACLHRAGDLWEFDVWAATVRERLPRVAVPLEAGWPDIILDLQEVLDKTYEEGAYARRLDYTDEPYAPLPPEDREWAHNLLRDKGLAPAR